MIKRIMFLVLFFFLLNTLFSQEQNTASWFEALCFNEENGNIPNFGPNGPTSNSYYFLIWKEGEKANSFLLGQKGNYKKTNLIISPFYYLLNAENVALLLLIDINSERELFVEQISKFIAIEPGASSPYIQLMKWIGDNPERFSLVVDLLLPDQSGSAGVPGTDFRFARSLRDSASIPLRGPRNLLL
jgi:hypothetical protein